MDEIMTLPKEIQGEFEFPVLLSDDKSGKICMRHEFERMTYSLSDIGQKILFEILAKLNSYESGKGQVVRISAGDLNRLDIGFSKSHIYRAFDDACSEVQQLQLAFRGSDNNFNYTGKLPLFKSSVTQYRKNTKKIEAAYFVVSTDAAPYLTELTKEMRFSTILAEEVRKLKRSSSMRLYQWLRRYHWVTKKTTQTEQLIAVDELMLKLDFGQSTQAWRDFRRRVLDPSVKEVNEKSDVFCQYSLIKGGRGGRVVSVVFTIKNIETFHPLEDDIAKAVEIDLSGEAVSKIDDGVIVVIRKIFPDITDLTLDALSLYSQDVVIESVLYCAKAMVGEKIVAPIDYFLSVVTNKAKGVEEEKLRTMKEKLGDRSWDNGMKLEGTD